MKHALVNLLASDAQFVVPDNGVPDTAEYFVTNVGSSNRCMLRLTDAIADGSKASADFGMIVHSVLLDLSHADPLSVSVETVPWRDFVYYKVNLAGTSQALFITGTTSTYDFHHGFRPDFASHKRASSPCLPKADVYHHETEFGRCKDEPLQSAQWSFNFSNLEMAKRFSRALMHAALVCGGPKAVSPF
jgi:hypothetical protein